MQSRLLFIAMLLCCVQMAFAQITVSGTVTDNKNTTLVGVTVFEKGSFNGTTTAGDGTFSVNCKSKTPTLVFSYLGFETQEVSSDGLPTMKVVLLDDTQSLKGVEVVGSRNINRTATETAVPIDIIPVSRVTNQIGQVDLNQLLQFAAPSFNSNRQSGSDGTDHTDPASLRGLGPDQTLVLINGQRRHQSSLVNLYGTRGRGNTGTDLNTIPAACIERIEILRDGAAAQYGSDAIAGVINIVLKKNTETLTAAGMVGSTVLNDGFSRALSANYGWKLGETGFLNATVAYNGRNKTDRARQYRDSLYRRQFGDASLDDISVFLNASAPLKKGGEIYAFGGFNHREGDAFAWSRDADSKRNVTAIYPDGFDPHIATTIDDHSLSAGARGKVLGINVDFNNTFGNNRFHYFNNQTLNASLGAKSPLNFNAGGFQLMQNTTNLRFSKNFEKILQGFNVAWGVEHRFENYKIFAGEEGSWKDYGPVFFSRDPLLDTAGVIVGYDTTYRPGGSQGFPGFRPSNELNKSRTNIGGYVDTELDITKDFMISAAARYEKYSDFGSTLNGKVAARYKIVDDIFMVRASYSTGFRAPSLAQVYFNSTFTNVISGKPVDVLLAANGSDITTALGIAPLKQETSENISFGFTSKPMSGLSITVDGYRVDIKDRIVLTSAFSANTDTDWGRALIASKVGQAQFFTNAVDTRTVGLDAIVTYAVSFGADGGRLQTAFAANFNRMEIDTANIKLSDKLKTYPDAKNTYFNTREQKFLLASAPMSKYSLSFDYKLKRFNTMLRFTRFDKIVLEDWLGRNHVYTPKVTTDLTLGYEVTKSVSVFVGGTNLLNVYPDTQNIETEGGGVYDPVQMGLQGAFYFARIGFKL
jgi:iron complex outermembrane recepter protein